MILNIKILDKEQRKRFISSSRKLYDKIYKFELANHNILKYEFHFLKANIVLTFFFSVFGQEICVAGGCDAVLGGRRCCAGHDFNIL